MNSDDARDAAFNLRTASDYLREYAVLLRAGVERPWCLELAVNNLRCALGNIGAEMKLSASPEEMHRRMAISRRAELAAEEASHG
jgi:hypothetical protein